MQNLDEIATFFTLASLGMVAVESFRQRKPQLKSDISDTINKDWSKNFKNEFSEHRVSKANIIFYRNKLRVQIETIDGVTTTSTCTYTNLESRSIRPRFYHYRASAIIFLEAPDHNGNTSLKANVSGLTNFFVKNNPSNIIEAITPAVKEGFEKIKKQRALESPKQI